MPESPCKKCGKAVLHTDDDTWPLCDFCTEVEQAEQLLEDIVWGRLKIPARDSVDD